MVGLIVPETKLDVPSLEALERWYDVDWEEHRPGSLRAWSRNLAYRLAPPLEDEKPVCIAGAANNDPDQRDGFFRAWWDAGSVPYVCDRVDLTMEDAKRRALLGYHVAVMDFR